MLIAVDAQGGVRQMSIGGLMKGQARQRIRALAAAKGIAYTAVE